MSDLDSCITTNIPSCGAGAAEEEDVYLVKRQKDCDRMLSIKHQGHRDDVIMKNLS